MPRSPTTTNGEGTADAGTDIKEGYVQASSRSGSQSPKVETIEGTLSRKQGTSCRSLAAQYAHSAPMLALRWPGQPGTIHGTSNRMPQTVHFASMRSSGVREMTVSSLPGRRSRVRRTRPIFLREATATVSATGRGMDNTEGGVRGEPFRHDQGRGDRAGDAGGVGQQMFAFLPAMRVPQGLIAVDYRPVEGVVATGTGLPSKDCSVLHRFTAFFCRGMHAMPMVSCGTPPGQLTCAGSARSNGTHA